MRRQDFAYPFHLDAAARRAAEAAYADHVAQMIRLVLLTDPGERVNLPEFGCGLRRLVFAPYSDALQATTRLLVLQSLSRWLSREIKVTDVRVSNAGDMPDGVLEIDVDYVLLDTQQASTTQVSVV